MSASGRPQGQTDGARPLASEKSRDEAAEKAAAQYGVSPVAVRVLAEQMKRMLAAATQVVVQETGLPVDLVRQATPILEVVLPRQEQESSPIIPLPRVLRLRGGDERDRILAAVADEFNVSVDKLVGRGRTRDLSTPRQLAMWLLRKRTSLTLVQVARQFGVHDHTTVVYAVEKTAQRLENPVFNDRVVRILAVLEESDRNDEQGAGQADTVG